MRLDTDPRNGLCYDLRHVREGYYFVSGPLLKPIELTIPEALALALAAQQARDTGTVDATLIGGVLARLEGALPRGIVPYLRRAADASPVPFGPVRERGATLAALEQAMAERRTVEIVYATASRNGSRSRRTIAPYYLQPYERSWLAIAMDTLRGHVRMFKVDRIESYRLTAERFKMPKTSIPYPIWGRLGASSAESRGRRRTLFCTSRPKQAAGCVTNAGTRARASKPSLTATSSCASTVVLRTSSYDGCSHSAPTYA